MARRTKEELKAANYYEWLKVCSDLKTKKKDGFKLTSEEKQILRTVPTPEAPFAAQKDATAEAQKDAVLMGIWKRRQKAAKAKITFDKTVVWPVKGNAFLCAVFNTPYKDEQCLLFCEKDDCPFHSIGYFRAHGIKF